MNATTTPDVREAVKTQVEKIVATGGDIRRELVPVISQAACRCQETGEKFVGLIGSVLEGARAGMEKSVPQDRDDVLRQVVDALGDGLSQTALAGRLALEEAVTSSRRFNEKELTRLRNDLAAVRDLFVETVSHSLNAGKTLTQDQLASARTHADRVAARIGPVFNEVLEAVRKNPAALARETVHAGVRAGQGAADSLCKSLSRLLKPAAEELDSASKPKK